MKPMKRVLGCLRKADEDYDLISDGDRIAVGISGGKDSSLLLYALHLYKLFSKKEYSICGIYIDLGFGQENMDKVKQFFSGYDVEIHSVPSQISEILHLHEDDNHRISCSLCANLRKGALVNAAKKYGCNKIALGHHNDDAVETLFMNMIHGGRIATFQPLTLLSRSQVTMIRPLIYAYEKDVARCCQELEIPLSKNPCPNSGYSERQKIKEMLQKIYHEYPGSHDSFQLMLHNDEQVSLLKPKKDKIPE